MLEPFRLKCPVLYLYPRYMRVTLGAPPHRLSRPDLYIPTALCPRLYDAPLLRHLWSITIRRFWLVGPTSPSSVHTRLFSLTRHNWQVSSLPSQNTASLSMPTACHPSPLPSSSALLLLASSLLPPSGTDIPRYPRRASTQYVIPRGQRQQAWQPLPAALAPTPIERRRQLTDHTAVPHLFQTKTNRYLEAEHLRPGRDLWTMARPVACPLSFPSLSVNLEQTCAPIYLSILYIYIWYLSYICMYLPTPLSLRCSSRRRVQCPLSRRLCATHSAPCSRMPLPDRLNT